MGKIIGIDDAGRGPVIGPMILAGVMIEGEDEEIFRGWGAKDSKLLSVGRRKQIGDKIVRDFKHFILVTTPREIDESSNLNYLEAIKAAMIINKLMEGVGEKVKVIIDCPSVNISAWCEDVRSLVEKKELVDLHCEHKADYNHPVVSAASIIAKEKREEEVARLRKEFGVDFGSGYPADPKTKKFIEKNFDSERYGSLIRFSWKTVKNLAGRRGQKKLF